MMTRAEEKALSDMWRRLNAAQNELAEQRMLNTELHEQLDRANSAAVRMAQRLQTLLRLREAA